MAAHHIQSTRKNPIPTPLQATQSATDSEDRKSFQEAPETNPNPYRSSLDVRSPSKTIANLQNTGPIEKILTTQVDRLKAEGFEVPIMRDHLNTSSIMSDSP